MQNPDFFAFEQKLIDRLKATVDEPGMNWFGSDDDTEVERRAQFAPAIHVVFGGYRPVGEAKGRKQVVEQTWIIIRSVKNAAGGQAQRDQAGPALGKILTALLGWPRPGSDPVFSALRLAAAGGMRRTGTVAHYPLAFITQLPVEGQPD